MSGPGVRSGRCGPRGELFSLEAWGEPARADELELAMRMASPQWMHAWRQVADEDTLAEWSGYLRPLVDRIALPIE